MPVFKNAAGEEFFYREHGNGERAVLLIHGNLGSSLWWERVLEQMPSDVRAIAPDNRGCGDSCKPETPWTVADLAADAYELMRGLGCKRYTVVGHSFGGGIAMQLAADHPEAVERLMLINSAPADGLHFPETFYAQMEGLVKLPHVLKGALVPTMPTAPRDEFYERLLEETVAKSAGAWIRNTRALDALNAAGGLATFNAPALIVYGQQNDPVVTPAMAELTQRQIPGSVLELWPEVGHSAPVEAPAKFVDRLLQFLG